MSRKPSTFRKRDVKAAIQAVQSAGMPIARVEITLDGRITVFAGKPDAMNCDPSWDRATDELMSKQ